MLADKWACGNVPNNRMYGQTRIFTQATGIVFTRYILTIAPGSYATIGAYVAAVQAAFRAVWPTWTISAEGAKYKIITDPTITLIIPSFSDLTNPDWIRDNWTGPSYNPNATNSANPGFWLLYPSDPADEPTQCNPGCHLFI